MSGIRTLALVFAIAAACVGKAGATPLDQAGALYGSAQHLTYASPDWHVAAAPELDQGVAAVGSAFLPNGGTGISGALVINPTFDTSITGDPNAVAIEAMINNAIAIFESLFNDPITVFILFRYSTALPNGSPLPAGALAETLAVRYIVPWNTYITALTADATTADDATANASLPTGPLSTNILPSSAGGRAIGLNTRPAMFANGSLGSGGPYDGIITLNSSAPFKFTRPPGGGLFDAERTTEHEIDEVLGLGSSINFSSDLQPQDLFSWSAPGARNVASSGVRYFSIDGGTTNIVGFNENPMGDFGDWLSGACPQAIPFVQNAFGCADQEADVTQTSPEGINLDVIGYDLITATTTTTQAPMPTTTTIVASATTTTLPCTTPRCILEAAETTGPCSGQTIPASVTRKFTHAEALIDQAATSPAKAAVKLRKNARKALKQAGTKATRAGKGKRPKLSAACAMALKDVALRVAASL